MKELRLGDEIITYELFPHVKSKRIKITITKDRVRVSFPRGTDIKKVEEFVDLKKEWIFNAIEKYKAQEGQIHVHDFAAGEEYFFLGKGYILRTKIHEEINPAVERKPGEIWVYLPKHVPERDWPLWIKMVLEAWYKDQAKVIFREKLGHYSKIMGLKFNQLRIKNQSTRWGSCSSKGNINLNWRVIMASDEIINYLIVHELAHLKYMNHSNDFWHFVSQFITDYEKQRKWLKENGKFLIL